MKTPNHNLKSKAFPLIILLYLTTENEVERPFLQKFLQSQNLRLEKLKGKTKGYPNANYIIRSHSFFSLENGVLLNQLWLSKVTVLSFFYNGHMFNTTRLKQLQPNLGASLYSVWKFFEHQNF